MNPAPAWLSVLAWTYLCVCFACALVIVGSILRRPQKMWVMDLVWPITALYFGPISVWMYFRTMPVSAKDASKPGEDKKNMQNLPPTREQIATAVFHCGAGCTLGDIIGEAGLFAMGGLMFVAGSEFATKLTVDFILAYLFGIFFQYFTIVPMRGLSPGKGIVAAARADTISIVAFEIGMFVWMAITRFVFFPEPNRIHPSSPVFWFMMQLAMILGWATSYPANNWLLKKGWKEKMPRYPSTEVRALHTIPNTKEEGNEQRKAS